MRRCAGALARSLRVGLVVLLTLLSVAPRAYADEAAARAHFKRGIDRYDKRQYAEALTAFQDAYREKPSAGIKQNIALSLKGLNRPAEAASSLDEALEEGKGTLKPETKAAIELELAELTGIVATVRLTVVTTDNKPTDTVILSLQPATEMRRTLPPGAQHRPIRLMPGIYTFSAHLEGYPDPADKKFALLSGAPVDATFRFGVDAKLATAGPNEGVLTVKASVEGAAIRIDGVQLGRGTWTGPLPAGSHRVEVSSPGWRTTSVDVAIPAGASIDHPVTLQAIGEAPSEYVAPRTKLVKPKRMYIVMMGAIDGGSYRLAPALGEAAPSGVRRGFVGLSVGARAGYLVAKNLALEILAEFGGVTSQYKPKPLDALETKTNIAHWQLTPMARFVTKGKVRFATATGVGVHGLRLETKLAQQGSTLTKTGSGVGFSWLIDAGIQADVGPVYLELVGFLNVHGVGSVRDDDAPEGRLLLASPSVRGGVRVGLGIPF